MVLTADRIDFHLFCVLVLVQIQIVFPIFLRMVKAEREARAVATLLRATTNLLESPAALSYDAGTSVDAFFRRVLTALHEYATTVLPGRWSKRQVAIVGAAVSQLAHPLCVP